MDCARLVDGCSKLSNLLSGDDKTVIVKGAHKICLFEIDKGFTEPNQVCCDDDYIVGANCVGSHLIVATATQLKVYCRATRAFLTSCRVYSAKHLALFGKNDKYSLVVVGTANGVICCLVNGTEIEQLDHVYRSFSITALAFSKDGKFLVCAALDGHTAVWAVNQDRNTISQYWIGVVPSAVDRVVAMQFGYKSVDGSELNSRVAITSWNGQLLMLDNNQDTTMWKFSEVCADSTLCPTSVPLLAWSPNGSFIAIVASDGVSVNIKGINTVGILTCLKYKTAVRGLRTCGQHLLIFERTLRCHTWKWPPICSFLIKDVIKTSFLSSSQYVLRVKVENSTCQLPDQLLFSDCPLELTVIKGGQATVVDANFLPVAAVFDCFNYTLIAGINSFSLVNGRTIFICQNLKDWSAVYHDHDVIRSCFCSSSDILVSLCYNDDHNLIVSVWRSACGSGYIYQGSHLIMADSRLFSVVNIVGDQSSNHAEAVIQLNGSNNVAHLWMCSIGESDIGIERYQVTLQTFSSVRPRVCFLRAGVVVIAEEDDLNRAISMQWYAPTLSLFSSKFATAVNQDFESQMPKEFFNICRNRLEKVYYELIK